MKNLLVHFVVCLLFLSQIWEVLVEFVPAVFLSFGFSIWSVRPGLVFNSVLVFAWILLVFPFDFLFPPCVSSFWPALSVSQATGGVSVLLISFGVAPSRAQPGAGQMFPRAGVFLQRQISFPVVDFRWRLRWLAFPFFLRRSLVASPDPVAAWAVCPVLIFLTACSVPLSTHWYPACRFSSAGLRFVQRLVSPMHKLLSSVGAAVLESHVPVRSLIPVLRPFVRNQFPAWFFSLSVVFGTWLVKAPCVSADLIIVGFAIAKAWYLFPTGVLQSSRSSVA
jgi:hypothetical protein